VVTTLAEPDVDENHPRALYHSNVRAGECVIWHSESASSDVLLDYVLGLLLLDRTELRSTPAGFAETRDGKLLLALLEGERGVSLTIWSFDGGSEIVNGAISREWEKMREELGRGEYRGNPASARWTPLVHGAVREDFEGSEVLSFVNGADVVAIEGGLPPAPPPVPAFDEWDDGKVEAYLDADPDVVSWEAMSPTIRRVHVRVPGMDGVPPVNLLVATGLNDTMVMIMAAVDADRLGPALKATEEIGTVGLSVLGDGYYLRFGAFKAQSDMMAMVNGLQSVAIAYYRYLAS
jgi:hypothetical protein